MQMVAEHVWKDAVAVDRQAGLLAAAVTGDQRAFGQLVTELAGPALSTAIKVLGDRALAEDAVQDALHKLWREGYRFDPDRGRFSAWWRRIVMNSALDHRRRLRPVADLDEASAMADPGPDPERLAQAGEVAELVETAAGVLPPRQRAALLLFYGEGHSMAEIADLMETTEKAVEGLLLRGRTALKAGLGEALGMELE